MVTSTAIAHVIGIGLYGLAQCLSWDEWKPTTTSRPKRETLIFFFFFWLGKLSHTFFLQYYTNKLRPYSTPKIELRASYKLKRYNTTWVKTHRRRNSKWPQISKRRLFLKTHPWFLKMWVFSNGKPPFSPKKTISFPKTKPSMTPSQPPSWMGVCPQ